MVSCECMMFKPKMNVGSGAEEKFIQLFCDVFGPEKGQYVYLQYPIIDIYGKHRSIDFAVRNSSGKIAFEIDGTTWHNPASVSESKYIDDLLKQNSMVYEGWKVFRWTDKQLEKTPDRVKDELVTFLGETPALFYLDDDLPAQNGRVFVLREHQEEALVNLERMRAENQTIALVQGATGSGKSAIGVLDAKKLGKRTLFLAHTKELVEQGYHNFRKLWPEATAGMMVDKHHDTDQMVICASVQSIVRNLDLFRPDDFEYLIIDECHHASADTYKRILAYFRTSFTLGLTATPERADGEDLLAIFQTMAHKLDIKEAVESGILVPVRCIRVKTNIDLRDVRIQGFKYNSLDLETKIMVPGRNQLIVDTYLEYVKDKPTVVFCTSVKHANEIADLFRKQGITAESISGSTNSHDRKYILHNYEEGQINVLCACDLLNEGWDSPKTEVLFMARPTMSKTIYMQQLGRGMRTSENKQFLMVFDFVDNANMFNAPYSMHRLFHISQYRPGGLVLGTKHAIHWDQDMFAKGEKPEVLIDYPVHVSDYEQIDLFNWQEHAETMLSLKELTRRINVRAKRLRKCLRDGDIIPDMVIPISEKKSFIYFEPTRVKEICSKFGWTEITNANRKDIFINNISRMQMDHSYKPVFLLSFFEHMDEQGSARIEDVVDSFMEFYEERKQTGLMVEKNASILLTDTYTKKDVEQLMLSMPFKVYEEMGVMSHSRYIGTIQLDKQIAKRLDPEDIELIRQSCRDGINKYFGEESSDRTL